MKKYSPIALVLLLWLGIGFLGCSPTSESKPVATSPSGYPQFKNIKLSYCETCTTAADIRKYEDSLGSIELKLHDVEIAQAFRYFPYKSQDSSGNYYSYPVIGTHIDRELHSYVAFERTLPGLSPLRLAVMYSLAAPNSSLAEILYEVEFKFFFNDPIIERYRTSRVGSAHIDTAYISSLFDTVALRTANFFPDTSSALVMNSESGFFEVEQERGWWFMPAEEVDFWGSKCPLDGAPYFFPDWRLGYRSKLWATLQYGFGQSNPGGIVGSGEVEIGWSAAPDYYHRRERPNGQKVHWFEVGPADMAIYLVLSTGG